MEERYVLEKSLEYFREAIIACRNLEDYYGFETDPFKAAGDSTWFSRFMCGFATGTAVGIWAAAIGMAIAGPGGAMLGGMIVTNIVTSAASATICK